MVNDVECLQTLSPHRLKNPQMPQVERFDRIVMSLDASFSHSVTLLISDKWHQKLLNDIVQLSLTTQRLPRQRI